jgi:hypothetical protein
MNRLVSPSAAIQGKPREEMGEKNPRYWRGFFIVPGTPRRCCY